MGRLSAGMAAVRSWLFGDGGGNAWTGVTANDYVPVRRQASSGSSVPVTADSALRHSAVWACARLRANLVASTPLDVYRRVSGVQVEVPKPPLLISPGGTAPAYQAGSTNNRIGEWLWSSQFDLDRYGNAFGVIRAVDAFGLPAVVELASMSEVVVRGCGNRVSKVKVNGEDIPPELVWHERQYTVPGMALGLSPIMYAAWSIGNYLSAQKFGLDYFSSGGTPVGQLRNTMRSNVSEVLDEAKAEFKLAVQGRDIFVTGQEWEWTPAGAPEAAEAFLAEMQYGVTDVARFMDVPADMIDASSSGSSITYANITQRNTQLLVMHMGPVFERREAVLSSALPQPRYAKFNTDAILRMDPQTRAQLLIAQVAGKVRTPSEVRELDNLPPFTPEQLAEIAQVSGGGQRSRDVAEVIQKVYLGVGKVITADEAREIINAAGADLAVPGPVMEVPA